MSSKWTQFSLRTAIFLDKSEFQSLDQVAEAIESGLLTDDTQILHELCVGTGINIPLEESTSFVSDDEILREAGSMEPVELGAMIGDQYALALIARHRGESLIQIGKKLRVTHQGALFKVRAGIKKFRERKATPWLGSFSTRVATCLTRMGFRTQEQVLEALRSGELTAEGYKGRKVLGFDKGGFRELCQVLGFISESSSGSRSSWSRQILASTESTLKSVKIRSLEQAVSAVKTGDLMLYRFHDIKLPEFGPRQLDELTAAISEIDNAVLLRAAGISANLEFLLGPEYALSIRLRYAGRTFKQIGQEMGMDALEASNVFYEGLQEYRQRWAPAQWYRLFSTRTANRLSQMSFKDLQQVKSALEAGELNPRGFKGSKVDGLGRKSLWEICTITGVFPPWTADLPFTQKECGAVQLTAFK